MDAKDDFNDKMIELSSYKTQSRMWQKMFLRGLDMTLFIKHCHIQFRKNIQIVMDAKDYFYDCTPPKTWIYGACVFENYMLNTQIYVNVMYCYPKSTRARIWQFDFR